MRGLGGCLVADQHTGFSELVYDNYAPATKEWLKWEPSYSVFLSEYVTLRLSFVSEKSPVTQSTLWTTLVSVVCGLRKTGVYTLEAGGSAAAAHVCDSGWVSALRDPQPVAHKELWLEHLPAPLWERARRSSVALPGVSSCSSSLHFSQGRPWWFGSTQRFVQCRCDQPPGCCKGGLSGHGSPKADVITPVQHLQPGILYHQPKWPGRKVSPQNVISEDNGDSQLCLPSHIRTRLWVCWGQKSLCSL